MIQLGKWIKKGSLKKLLIQAEIQWPEAWKLLDGKGTFLAGNPEIAESNSCIIQIENQVFGTLFGRFPELIFFGEAFKQNLQLEFEKKQLGHETLELYREINLMFRFSEKLLHSKGLQKIAELTLEELSYMLSFENGSVFLWNETVGKLQMLAHRGALEPWQKRYALLENQVKNRVSGILDIPENNDAKILFVKLSLDQKPLGGIFLEGAGFSAADLKWVSNLGFQLAVTIENTKRQEKELAKALHEQKDHIIHEMAIKNPFYKKVVDLVQKGFSDPEFSVPKLADQLHLSVSQLQRKVFSVAELSPVDLIRSMRLDHAKKLLKYSDLSISEVAFQSGFNDPSYFTRLFSKELGISPKDWKKGIEQQV